MTDNVYCLVKVIEKNGRVIAAVQFEIKLFDFFSTSLNSSLIILIRTYTDFFLIGNGTKQGGVLSPYLFTRYVRDITANIVQSCTVVLLEMCSQTFLLMLMI